MLLAVGIAAIVMLTKVLVENVLGVDIVPWIQQRIAAPGPAAAATIVGLLLVDLFVPIPSSIVMVLSGAVFGVVYGGLLSLVGSLGCSVIGFELTRRFGRRASARLVGDDELARLEGTFARHGAGAVFVTRPLPVVKETMAVVAGLSRMRRSTFLVAATAGTIPEAALYAYAGAASRQLGNIMPAVLILMALAGAGWMLARRTT